MGNPLVTLFAFIVVLGVLVMVHEIGHFSMAKLFGVRVLEFAIGFPPRLFAKQRGETTYSINAIPLGGYVRMVGENGDDADDPESFVSKAWWKRAIVLMGGPAMNILLALILFFVTAAWVGTPIPTNVVDATSRNSPAQRVGLRSGDRITAVAGKPTPTLARIASVTRHHLGESITIRFIRNGRTKTVQLIPRKNPPADQGPVGVVMRVKEKRYPAGVATTKAVQGVGLMVMAIPNLIQSIGQHGTQNISGPVGIARATGQSASAIPHDGIGQFLAFMALLSANLGVLNLLPMPALDGGRLVLVIFAGVRRKNVNPQVEGVIHLVGMAMLLMLMVLISYQDVIRWVSGQ